MRNADQPAREGTAPGRFSPLASSVILAVLWFAWHIPQFLIIATYRDFAPVQYVGRLLG